ncbi:MAG: RNB domain-containing ribonuclease [Treponema sp.]|nr:RNB domain-containing ribonuclease [Treponema sp.]
MISKNSVVLYKKAPAIITECASAAGEKYTIQFCVSPATSTGKKAQYGSQKVRDKDFVLLHSSAVSQDPLSSLSELLKVDAASFTDKIKEAYELLRSDEESANEEISFEDLASLALGELEAKDSWAFYTALKNTFYFNESSTPLSFVPRTESEVEALVQKAENKGKEEELRAEFLKRLKEKKLNLPDDFKYIGDIESLALGKSEHSKTLKEIHLAETPENAHKVLLDCGAWNITRNPYPIRWGLSMKSASEGLSSPPEEERLEVEGVSYAIDNEWSTDPDDAIAYDGKYVWVHIADPASTVMPDSSIDKMARDRGATLYIPEGASRMLSEDALQDYALGLTEKSRALSFRLTLDEDCNVQECAVLKTWVKVERLTYSSADERKESPELAPLYDIARRNIEKRNKAGAVQIDLPEVHIMVDAETKKVSIENPPHPESALVVREMMLLAGEGAARFAFKNQIPFPYVSQEAPDIPSSLPEGLAGQYALRRCMHRRSVGITPGVHSGLGISMYTQVTSPLRRYSDLIAHEQLRAFIDGRKLIDKDTMLERVSAGDAAMGACVKAERKSDLHWTLVYLLQNPDWTGDAVCVDLTGKMPKFMIPSLALETNLVPNGKVELNGVIKVKVGKIDIPNLEVNFQQLDN